MLYEPDKREKHTGETLLYCLPGGGASHLYFDLGQSGGQDYSFASRMTGRGYRLMMIDHPGTGRNPLPPSHSFLTPWQASDYLAAAFPQFVAASLVAANGSAASRTAKPLTIGVGHSMGGMMIVLHQARHRIFSGIALLGSSARGLDWGLDEQEKKYVDNPQALKRDLEKLVLRKFGTEFLRIKGSEIKDSAAKDSGSKDKPSNQSRSFGGATLELTEKLRANTTELFAAGGLISMIRGSFSAEAAAIDVPIFFALGDRDIGAPPHEIPLDFKAAPQTVLHILEDCGHNSFAFPAIGELCDKLTDWIKSIEKTNLEKTNISQDLPT